MSLYNDISPRTLMIIGIIMAIVFVVMLIRILWNIIILRKGRSEQAQRVQGLLLSNMLDRLNIPLDKYFSKTSDLDKERHIWSCERCSDLEQCEDMFLGEDIKAETFCPNYSELESFNEKLKKHKI